MFAKSTGMLLKLLYRFSVRLLFTCIIVLSLTIAVLQIDSSRQEVFARIGDWSGWHLAIEKLNVGLGHAHATRVELHTKEGASFVCDDVSLNWGVLDLLLGRLNHMSMANPVWHFATPDKAEGGVGSADAWARILKEEVAPSTLWLFALRMNGLTIENGEIARVGDAETSWRMHTMRVFGENLSEDTGQLVFAGESDPAGVFSGHLQWDDEQHVVLHTRDMTAKPWFGLLNIGVTQGIANLDLDLRITPGRSVSANGRLDVQNIRSVDNWQGASTLYLTMRGDRLHWNGSGHIAAPNGTRKPLLMSGTLFHEREEWDIPDGTLKLGGMLDTQMRLRWKGQKPEWKLTTELHSPIKLMRWLRMQVPLPENAKWMQRKPWKITAHGENSGPEMYWTVEGVSGPDHIQYPGIDIKDVRTTLLARGKAHRLLEPISLELDAVAVDAPYSTMRYVEGSADLIWVNTGGWAMNRFRIGGEARAQDGRFQSFSWRGEARGAAPQLQQLKSVLHWHDARLEISYSNTSEPGRFSDAGWRLEIPQSHPLAVSRLSDITGRKLGQGQLYGLIQLWRDHALWKSRASWQVEQFDWQGNSFDLGISDIPHHMAIEQAALSGQAKLIFDPTSQGLSVQLEGNVPSGQWSLDNLKRNISLESPQVELQIRSEKGWRLDEVPFHVTGSSHQKGIGVVRWELDHQPAQPWSGKLRVEAGRLGHLYKHYLHPAMMPRWPDWEGSHLSGRLDMSLHFDDLHQWQNGGLKGQVQLRDAAFTGPNGNWQLQGVQMNLPMLQQAPTQPLTSEQSQLKVAKIRIGELELSPFESKPLLVEGTLFFGKDRSLKVEETPVELHSLKLEGIYKKDLRLHADATIHNLQLADWAQRYNLPIRTGNLSGRLHSIILDKGQITTQGQLTGSVWGGQLSLKNLHVSDTLKTNPQWGGDVRLVNIDLKQASDDLQLGKVEGVGHLTLSGLQLDGMQPKAFQASFNGGPKNVAQQRVNASMLRNLAILAGYSDSALKEAPFSMFDNFRYNRLGGKLKLTEGLYEVSGFKDRYGRGNYLLKGGPYPPRADITIDTKEVTVEQMDGRWSKMKSREEEITQKAP
ncbi:hypothetical protein [Magnetococcus sp. PR-3]|uniref:hypothetical protein n=1 Tax=Magnetococcus sp. PR-3 TaxID=3120355 RepID=UPI002FCE3A10